MLCVLMVAAALSAADETGNPVMDLEQVEAMRDSIDAAREERMDEAQAFIDNLMRSADAMRGSVEAMPDAPALARQGMDQASSMFGDGIDLDGMFDGRQPEGPVLYVLVTLGMPDQALRDLADEAEALNGTIVIRGLYGNSWQTTQARIMDLYGQDEPGGLMIDPRPFAAFGVEQVPAIIRAEHAVEPCGGLDCIPETPPHDMVRGNISIRAALEIMGHPL